MLRDAGEFSGQHVYLSQLRGDLLCQAGQFCSPEPYLFCQEGKCFEMPVSFLVDVLILYHVQLRGDLLCQAGQFCQFRGLVFPDLLQ